MNPEVSLCLRMALTPNAPYIERIGWAKAFVLAWQRACGIWDISTSDVRRARIYDATGQELHLVTWCNVNTGAVVQFLPEDDSMDVRQWIDEHVVPPPLKFVGRGKDRRPAEVRRVYPAPLRFVPD